MFYVNMIYKFVVIIFFATRAQTQLNYNVRDSQNQNQNQYTSYSQSYSWERHEYFQDGTSGKSQQGSAQYQDGVTGLGIPEGAINVFNLFSRPQQYNVNNNDDVVGLGLMKRPNNLLHLFSQLQQDVEGNSPTQQYNKENNDNRNEGLNPPEDLFGSNRQAGSDQKTLQSAPMYNSSYNPCTIKIVKPNFKRPGRRISESKCLDYIWEIKESEDKITMYKECLTYQERNGLLNGPAGSGGGQIGGRATEPGEFPHMVALGWRAVEGGWIFKCGASVISETFVLTAAHCTKSVRDPKISNVEPEIIRIGSKNLDVISSIPSPYPRDINIIKIIPHPNYKPPRQYYDIALMQVQYEMTFESNVKPACLWHRLETEHLGTTASSSGWGVTKIGGRETTTELQVTDLDLINSTLCDQLLKPMCNRLWCGIEEHQVCAGKLAGGVDACQGDSGGPLQVKLKLPEYLKTKMYYLLGITSFGFGCARKNSPGVYTRVAAFVDWIEQNVWPNEAFNG